MNKSLNEYFTDFADKVSAAMGTPANIGFWIFAVVLWIYLFATGIFTANTNILPAWFTSNAFNFPLNTVTTLAELYIGFLIAAAANRVEKRNWELHQHMMNLIERIEKLEEEEVAEIHKLTLPKKKRK